MIFLATDPFVVALFKHSFMTSALITGLMIGFISPLVGSFVVIRRLSFITDTLSHFSLAGLSIGLFLINIIGFTFISDPIYLSMIFSVIGAILIEILRGYYKNYKEISMPIVMSLGVALSVVFISLSGGYNSKIFNYLFGSILTVEDKYILVIAITVVITVSLIAIFYKEMVIISFDESYARLLGIKVNVFQSVSMIILAVVISLSMTAVGVLLVSSLMIIPVAAAMKIGKSFKNTIFIAIMFSEISVVGGLFLSYTFPIPSGASIVLINLVILVIIGIVRKFILNRRLKRTQLEIQSK